MKAVKGRIMEEQLGVVRRKDVGRRERREGNGS